MASDDPRFEQKAADIIGLYMNPPQHAAVFPWVFRPKLLKETRQYRELRAKNKPMPQKTRH